MDRFPTGKAVPAQRETQCCFSDPFSLRFIIFRVVVDSVADLSEWVCACVSFHFVKVCAQRAGCLVGAFPPIS